MQGRKRANLYHIMGWGIVICLVIAPLTSALAGPLHDAVARYDIGNLEKVLRQGIDIDAKDDHGRTALHIAATKGYPRISSRLTAMGADVDARDKDSVTPLLLASDAGHLAVVRALLAGNAELESTDSEGNTPLLLAARKGHAQVAASLVAHGANVDAKNESAATPLHLAARYDHKSVATVLIDAGADLEAKNRYGATPLYVASQSNSRSLEDLLVASGAEVNLHEPNSSSPYVAEVEEWSSEVAEIKLEMAQISLSERKLEDLQERLVGIRGGITRFANDSRRQAASVQKLLDALGPPPMEGQAAEPESVGERRQLLEEELTFYLDRENQAGLAATQAGTLIRQLSHLRQARFTETIFARISTPLIPMIWVRAGMSVVTSFSTGFERIQATFGSEEMKRAWRPALSTAGIAVFLALIISSIVRTWLIRGFGQNPAIKSPSYTRRLVAMIVEGVARTLPWAASSAALYAMVSQSGALAGEDDHILFDIVLALTGFQLARYLTVAALTAPKWRVATIGDQPAREVRRLIMILISVATVDLFLNHMGWISDGGEDLSAAYGLIVGVLFAFLIIRLLSPRLWQAPSRRRKRATTTPDRLWPTLRLVVGSVAIAMPIAALLGYAAFSRFLAERLLLTGLTCAVFLTLNGLVREFITRSLSRDSKIGGMVDRTLAMSDESRSLVSFWLSAMVGVTLFAASVLALLPFWGMNWQDLSEFLEGLIFGFQVGDTTVSLINVAAAIALFVTILMLTRFFQRFLGDQILTRTRLDGGIRHSLRASVGYIGIGIAAAIAISTLGIDLSNVAIILGGLSVGVGLGLQNVINNFVLGLILLIERPIKVGDKITFGEHIGFVQRINLRSTEIETFDKGDVIIPNSELLSRSVLNWTHKNRLGRIVIPIDVASGSDPKAVRNALLGCAKSHRDVADSPKPQVYFRNFGDTALQFELWAYLDDNSVIDMVSSDLRFSIDAAFRKAGIDGPVPRREVKIENGRATKRIVRTVESDAPGLLKKSPTQPKGRVKRRARKA